MTDGIPAGLRARLREWTRLLEATANSHSGHLWVDGRTGDTTDTIQALRQALDEAIYIIDDPDDPPLAEAATPRDRDGGG